LGLSLGLFCLGWCLPAFLPFLLSEERKIKESFKIFGKFLGGRFLAYLIFGAAIGYLGEKLQVSLLYNVAYFALLILGLLLIFYGLGKIKKVLPLCQAFKKIKTPWVLGFLLGLNLCPPFVGAVFYAFSLKDVLLSTLFFLAFFVGTSVYLVFPVFFGFFSSAKILQKVAQLACILSGIGFILFALKNLVFSQGLYFCPFLGLSLSFLKYPLEIFLLILALSFGVFSFLRKKYFYFRYFTLSSFLALAFFKFPQFCPFLTLQEVSLLRFSNFSALLFFILILISTLVVGRFFCGWACPILFFQEIIFRVSQKIKKLPEIKLPKKLIYLKFLILILILVSLWLAKDIVLCGKDPFGALFGFFRTSISLTFLFFLFLLSIFIFLPFCRYFCPLGAILNLFSKISIFQLKIKGRTYCQLGLISDNKIDNSECLRCGECQRKFKDRIEFKL